MDPVLHLSEAEGDFVVRDFPPVFYGGEMGSPHFDARSLWQQIDKPFFVPLATNATTDVCVVGAGIAGLSVAYALLKEGRSVIVIDRERLGLGETGLTSAHLASAMDDDFTKLRRLHGDDGLKKIYESHAAAIDEIERIARDENIDCDFERVDGYLFCGPDEDADFLRDEMEAARVAGFDGVELLASAPTKLFDTGPCLRFPRQAQFHPLKYLIGLARAIQDRGGRIHTHAEAFSIEGGRPARVTTSQGFQITCDDVVVATNVPFNNRLAIHTKIAPYRTYVIAVRVPAEKADAALFWDTSDPYHYVRFVKDSETNEPVALIGGEDHRTGHDVNPEHHFMALQQWARSRLGLDPRVVSRWSGQVVEPVDGLAFIGRNPGDADNVFIVTGDSGQGLTHGTIAALLLKDLVAGRENPWQDLYDPARVNLRSLDTFVREAITTNLPYVDWLSPGDVSSVDEIPYGEGAVLRDGLEKIAVYRDTLGRAHACSAVCPHLGGIVRWNSAEKTWDCPCHGSRFDKFGEVINGPAAHALPPVMDPSVRESEGLTPAP